MPDGIGTAWGKTQRFAVDDFKPPRDRMVHWRSIACPTCGCAVGETCIRADGQPGDPSTCHVARRRMAIRAGL